MLDEYGLQRRYWGQCGEFVERPFDSLRNFSKLSRHGSRVVGGFGLAVGVSGVLELVILFIIIARLKQTASSAPPPLHSSRNE